MSDFDKDLTVYGVLRRCRRAFLLVLLFSLLINLLMLTAPIYMLQVYDRVLTSRSVDTLIFLTVAALIAFITLWTFEVLRNRVMVLTASWLDRRLSHETLSRILTDSSQSAGSRSQPLRDVGVIRDFLTGQAAFPIFDSPWVPIYIAIVYLFHPLLAWIAIFGAFVIFFLALMNDFATRRAVEKAHQASTLAYHSADDALGNADVVESMGMAPAVVRRWHAANDHSISAHAQASARTGFLVVSSKLFRQLLQTALLGVGAWLVVQNQITAGAMIASTILVSRALAPVEQLISSWRSAVAARGAYRRLRVLFDGTAKPQQKMELPAPTGRIDVSGVSYAYPGAKVPFIRSVGFSLEPGESLGLIGATASGKSTLARIIVGSLKPQIGNVRLDGADIGQLSPEFRGKHVGYLAQEVELFDGTVRENIARLEEDVSEAVINAAVMSGTHDLVLGLPDGYETSLGRNGVALSGGQKQRIGLARAVYGDPRLVVLDEPNANLDQLGETALIQTVNTLKEHGATVIIIAHRPSVLRNVDKILVLHEGQVRFFGTRDEVMAQLAGVAGPTSLPVDDGRPQTPTLEAASGS